MKALLRFLLAGLVATTALGAHAQAEFEPGQLDALLAPIALYPDPLLSQILDASLYPQDVQAAAAWSRANPQLSGDAALATVQTMPWAPSAKALVAYPDVLARMAESPQWLADLGAAYATYGPNVMATVQDLRARAQASGYLQSNSEQYVYQQGQAIVVQPAYPNLVYAPYYDPYIVFGGVWTAYRPVVWRPWVPRPRFVTRVVVAPPVRWYVHPHATARVLPAPRIVQGGPTIRPYRPVPESLRQPIIHNGGTPYIHGGGTPYIHGAPAARAQFHSGFSPAARAAAHPGYARAAAGGGHHGGGHAGRR
jgi:hypothetical protein